MDAWEGKWWDPPELQPRNIRYHLWEARHNVITCSERSLHDDGRYEMGLPSFLDEGWVRGYVGTDKPIAVIRPNTLRAEWLNTARNCRTGYLALAAEQLAEDGYHTVSVASAEDSKEWLEEPMPWAHTYFNDGQLNTRQLLALFEAASFVVASPGFALPVALAYRTPMVCILGGNLRHNSPGVLTDPRMDTSRLEWLTPDDPCYCHDKGHRSCDKTIAGFSSKFTAAVQRLAMAHEAVAV